MCLIPFGSLWLKKSQEAKHAAEAEPIQALARKSKNGTKTQREMGGASVSADALC